MNQQLARNQPKFACYPMAGGVQQQVSNLLRTLKWIHETQPSQGSEIWKWLRKTFRPDRPLADTYVQKIYSVLLKGTGLVSADSKKCRLTRDGYIALHSPVYDHLLGIFLGNFVGLVEILEILREERILSESPLRSKWFATASHRFEKMRSWSTQHITNQFSFRANWLRAFEVIETDYGEYKLTASGQRFIAEHLPELQLLSPDEVHEEEEMINALVSRPFVPFDQTVERVQSLRQAYIRSRVFRNIVVREYSYACAICNMRLCTPDGIYEVQAAHIIPRSKSGTDDPRNGLALCGIHHWTFDMGLVSVDPIDLKVRVATYVRTQATDPSASQLSQFAGHSIRSTINKEYAPATESLQWHNENVFIS